MKGLFDNFPKLKITPVGINSDGGENIKIGHVRQLFVLPLRSIVAQVVGRKRRDHRNGGVRLFNRCGKSWLWIIVFRVHFVLS